MPRGVRVLREDLGWKNLFLTDDRRLADGVQDAAGSTRPHYARDAANRRSGAARRRRAARAIHKTRWLLRRDALRRRRRGRTRVQRARAGWPGADAVSADLLGERVRH